MGARLTATVRAGVQGTGHGAWVEGGASKEQGAKRWRGYARMAQGACYARRVLAAALCLVMPFRVAPDCTHSLLAAATHCNSGHSADTAHRHPGIRFCTCRSLRATPQSCH